MTKAGFKTLTPGERVKGFDKGVEVKEWELATNGNKGYMHLFDPFGFGIAGIETGMNMGLKDKIPAEGVASVDHAYPNISIGRGDHGHGDQVAYCFYGDGEQHFQQAAAPVKEAAHHLFDCFLHASSLVGRNLFPAIIPTAFPVVEKIL